MTDSKKTVAESISDFNKIFPGFEKDKTNPHYSSRYVSLDGVIQSIKKPLADAKLFLVQTTTITENGDPVLLTTIENADGDKISGTMPLVMERQNAQGFGSALTYARRYSICTMLNLVEADDDDGEGACATPIPNEKILEIAELIAKKQADEEALMKFIREQYKKKELKDLSLPQAEIVINMLRQKPDPE